MRYFCFIFIFLFSIPLCAQSLFEDAISGSTKEDTYELNGYLRGVFYGGIIPKKDEAEVKSGYAETSLKLRARRQNLGDGFAEIRFRKGQEFGEDLSEVDLREAYVNTYVGPFDFRFGHQIVAWGRADGTNPTDNITPKNMLVRSPNEDDRREGNFLLRSFFNLQPVRLEVNWVPFFKSSVMPTNLLSFPPELNFGMPDYPDAKLKNSAVAFKLNMVLPSFGGSLSYFNGYNPFPGIAAVPNSSPEDKKLSVFPKAYRMHVLGGDFSTTVAGFGLRGEVAYKKPHGNYKNNLHIPYPELHYVIGLDKEFFSGDFNIILQYIGRYVFDYTELKKPRKPGIPSENPEYKPAFKKYELALKKYEFALKNRMISSQQYELSHSVSCRVEWKLLHEKLKTELVSMVNMTSEEFFLKPEMAYDIADALTFTLGGEFYSGPKNTLFNAIDSNLNAVFTELKLSF